MTTLHLCSRLDASAVLEVSLKQFWKLFFSDPKFYSDVHIAKGDKSTFSQGTSHLLVHRAISNANDRTPVARTGEWAVGEEGFYVRPHYFEQEIKSKLMRGKICKVDQTQQACLINDKYVQQPVYCRDHLHEAAVLITNTCHPLRRFVFGTDSRMEGVPLASDFTVKTYWEVCEEQPRLVNIHVWLWVDWIKVPFGLKGTASGRCLV
jgi:hypothetical protein